METPTAKRCAKVRRFSGNANLFWGNVDGFLLMVLSCRLSVFGLNNTIQTTLDFMTQYFIF
jgi:hypothetical protein